MDIIPTERKNIYILVRNTYVVHINTLAQSSKKTVESMMYKNLEKGLVLSSVSYLNQYFV